MRGNRGSKLQTTKFAEGDDAVSLWGLHYFAAKVFVRNYHGLGIGQVEEELKVYIHSRVVPREVCTPPDFDYRRS